MAKSTQLNIRVNGIDKASMMFRRIGNIAKSIAVPIAAVGAGAAAAGVAFMRTWQSMTSIGDLAAKAGTTAENLQKMTSALGQLGIQGANVEAVAQAFAVMQKNTGGVGVDGFIKAIDAAKQSAEPLKALTETFGKAGLNLAPLLAGSSDALRELIDMQFAAGNGAVAAATKAANAWQLFKDGALNAWYDMAGKVATILDNNIEGGVYSAAYKSVAYVTAAVKTVFDVVSGLVSIGKMLSAAVGAPFEALAKWVVANVQIIQSALSAVWDAATEMSVEPLKRGFDEIKTLYGSLWDDVKHLDAVERFNEANDNLAQSMMNIGDNFREAAASVEGAVSKAAKLDELKSKAAGTFTGIDSVGTTSVGAARNDLILGGSYASMSAALKRTNETQKTRVAAESAADSLKNINNKLDFKVI